MSEKPAPSDPYQNVRVGRLKLKGELLKEVNGDGSKVRRRKKRDIQEISADAQILTAADFEEQEEAEKQEFMEMKRQKTEAELKFEKARRKKEKAEAKKTAAKSYRERIQEFNAHISQLTEHHDIPKVGPG